MLSYFKPQPKDVPVLAAGGLSQNDPTVALDPGSERRPDTPPDVTEQEEDPETSGDDDDNDDDDDSPTTPSLPCLEFIPVSTYDVDHADTKVYSDVQSLGADRASIRHRQLSRAIPTSHSMPSIKIEDTTGSNYVPQTPTPGHCCKNGDCASVNSPRPELADAIFDVVDIGPAVWRNGCWVAVKFPPSPTADSSTTTPVQAAGAAGSSSVQPLAAATAGQSVLNAAQRCFALAVYLCAKVLIGFLYVLPLIVAGFFVVCASVLLLIGVMRAWKWVVEPLWGYVPVEVLMEWGRWVEDVVGDYGVGGRVVGFLARKSFSGAVVQQEEAVPFWLP